MELRNTTKMAIQAALAISIAEIISLTFVFDRGYWITLTAMALTTQTWGESIKRSFERVGMTILGGLVGTALYFLLPQQGSHLFFFLLIGFIFFTVYLIRIHHLVSVFFLTCVVVFLFALFGNWTWDLLRIRIVDTILGAIIALIVGFLVFPLKTNINGLLVNYLEKMKALLTTFFTNTKVRTLVTRQSLSTDLQKIRKAALAIRYELFFHRLKPADFNAALNNLVIATRYTFNLVESSEWLFPHFTEEEAQMMAVAYKTTEKNLLILINYLRSKNAEEMLGTKHLSCLIEKTIQENPKKFAELNSDALGFFSLLYFFIQVNMHLKELYQLLAKT
ncbi:Predicted membrane protein (plasmid) [Legionella adelaidensis]|uniref:Fusaric acid resistance protein family protein n=1 Tax=Legionella adelaidensis TaxID=45056 RepID=A0A0W0R0G4_9GAMM|nr:FUSC family protein [Legionella adelaidensis]KTC64475.1 Fusaric acid resistance protein family protein [Legionella adelaidensis]VEH85843.1 Predicted membrane protein [Legionella adelaidensis]